MNRPNVTVEATADAVTITLPLDTTSDDPATLLAAACAMAAATLTFAPITDVVERNGARRHAAMLDAWAESLRESRLLAHDLREQRFREQTRERDAALRARSRKDS